jgi:hypothetical protein
MEPVRVSNPTTRKAGKANHGLLDARLMVISLSTRNSVYHAKPLSPISVETRFWRPVRKMVSRSPESDNPIRFKPPPSSRASRLNIDPVQTYSIRNCEHPSLSIGNLEMLFSDNLLTTLPLLIMYKIFFVYIASSLIFTPHK